ncbi:MAG: polysaccharide biosynthesis tyrosine autokinase [Anaerolineae bacterium]|nr:polysaccharide biosynthesis tyrosine autokinase [Anaerolineae bacterium]
MNDFIELRKIIDITLKWWWLIIILTITTAATGYAVSRRQTPVYKSSTTVIVGRSIQATDLDRTDIFVSTTLAQTYANMARRQPVLQGVIDTLNLNSTWTGLKRRVSVSSVEGTQLLEISVEAKSPEEAQLTANEVANQLIRLSPTALENQANDENQLFVRGRLEDLQAKIEGGQERLQVLESAMANSLSAQQVQELQSEINTLEGLINDWENNFTQLLIYANSEKSPNYLAIVEPAQINPSPIRPRNSLNTLIAGVLGFGLALGAVFLIEFFDDSLKSADDLAEILGLTTLGTVSQMQGRNYHDKHISFQDPFSPEAEAYRMIRSNIQFMAVDRKVRSIMITSSTPGEGKSTTAANLGVIMAQADLKTVIVDADLRRPVQHKIFQIPNLGGLTELLCTSDSEIGPQLRKTKIDNLKILTSGVLPPNPAELLGSQRMGQLLAGLNELADVVIYDSPPVGLVTDAAILSNRVDGTVMIVDSGRTRHQVARQAMASLRQANARILGAVLNRATKNLGENYYHRYYRADSSRPVNRPIHLKIRNRLQSSLPFLKWG